MIIFGGLGLLNFLSLVEDGGLVGFLLPGGTGALEVLLCAGCKEDVGVGSLHGPGRRSRRLNVIFEDARFLEVAVARRIRDEVG